MKCDSVIFGFTHLINILPVLCFVPQDLKNEENSVKAVQCLNDMVTNSLIHVDDCLKYMSALREPGIFRFCAIPQVRNMLKLTFEVTLFHVVSFEPLNHPYAFSLFGVFFFKKIIVIYFIAW